MRLWPVFEVHRENLVSFDSLDGRQVCGIYVSLLPSIEVLRTSIGKRKTARFLPDSLSLVKTIKVLKYL